jgi:hypothetical protein
MRQLTIIVVILFLSGTSNAQGVCETVSLRQFYDQLKLIDYTSSESLTFTKYPNFSFKEFKPLDTHPKEKFCFKIGYNRKQELMEIIRMVGNNVVYRLKVYDFEGYRILIPADENEKNGYYPTAILMDKIGKYNYLISDALPPGETGMVHVSMGGMGGLRDVKDLSTIMILDEDLFATKLLKAIKGRVVFAQNVRYTDNHKIDYTDAFIFFSPELHQNLQIDVDSCPPILVENCERPEMTLRIKPQAFGKEVEPLWDLFGDW